MTDLDFSILILYLVLGLVLAYRILNYMEDSEDSEDQYLIEFIWFRMFIICLCMLIWPFILIRTYLKI